ncbi:hypothetical protein, partial [Leifsonia sp. SIMBA_070]|uniref:hypothetical protein n=1 Tax=Leifsonia sp. SIMBA_070 TaxID=3085810 RepID=UPI00397D91A1
DKLLKKSFLSKADPIVKIGFQEQVLTLYREIIFQVKNEPSGYQPQVSGAALHLIGLVYSLYRQETSELNSGNNDLMKQAIQKI